MFENLHIASILIQPPLIISGLLVGILVGLTGVGGGSLMTPLLILVFKIHPATAVGTDLLFAAATKTFGTMVHSHKQTINWKIVGFLTLGSVPAALLTVYFFHNLGHVKPMAATIKTGIGIALLFTVVTVLLRPKIIEFAKKQKPVPLRYSNFTTLIAGILLGFLVALTSVGAGAIGVTFLVLLYPKLRIVEIVGTDIAHAIPLTFAAGAANLFIGNVDTSLLYSMLIGSIPGIIAGSWLAPIVPEKFLRFTLAGILFLVALKTLN